MGGLEVVKPVAEIFGVRNLPVLFRICSPTCRQQLMAAVHVPRFDDVNDVGKDGVDYHGIGPE